MVFPRARRTDRQMPPRAPLRSITTIALLCILALSSTPGPARAANTALLGAGSTFDAPFFAQAFGAYAQSTAVSVNYQAVGSGAGIQQFIKGNVDFGATDVPMNQLEQALAQGTGSDVVQIPVVLGGVAIAYNEPKIAASVSLQLDGATLAAIFRGKITQWNDPAITALNSGITLPADYIRPVHRADSSGTTYIFSDYLSAISPEWASSVGKGKSVLWPGGFRGTGSPGVSAWLRHHQGSIGYVELKYAIDNHIPYIKIKNQAGNFVWPSLASVGAAAAQFPMVTADHFSIVNAPGPQSYPIASYSWVLLRRHPATPERGAALVKLIRWLTTSGQSYAAPLNYAPLPASAQKQAATSLAALESPALGTTLR